MRAGALARKQTASALMSHPVRVQILVIANERPISPSRYVEEVMGYNRTEYPEDYKRALTHIAYHFLELEKAKCIELVRERPVRGSVEHDYRGVERAHFTDEEWSEVPSAERHQISTVTWQGLVARTEAARLACTLDARDNRWLAWTAAKLDERGWAEMTATVAASFAELEQIRKDAEARLGEDGGAPIHATFALMAYESPGHVFYADLPATRRPRGS